MEYNLAVNVNHSVDSGFAYLHIQIAGWEDGELIKFAYIYHDRAYMPKLYDEDVILPWVTASLRNATEVVEHLMANAANSPSEKLNLKWEINKEI